MSKPIPGYPLTSTLALDKVLAQHSKAMAQADQTMAKANAKIDRAFNKANQAIVAATTKVLLVSKAQFGL